MQLIVNRRETGIMLSALREKQKKMQKGVDRFGDAFNPELGAGLLDGLDLIKKLIHKITGVVQDEGSDPRSAGRDPA